MQKTRTTGVKFKCFRAADGELSALRNLSFGHWWWECPSTSKRTDKLQSIFVFEGRKFWSNRLDVERLNEKILELNMSGWIVKSVSPSFSILGMNRSYTILMELPD